MGSLVFLGVLPFFCVFLSYLCFYPCLPPRPEFLKVVDFLEIIKLPLSELTPYSKNTKKHPQKQIDEIKQSIKLYGMNDPIAVWGEKNTIVEGHGRYEALKQLGITAAPCIRLDHLTDKERREYTIAHNKINADSGMDKSMLSLELPELDLEWLGYEDEEEEDDDRWYFGEAREKTYSQYNLRDFDETRATPTWGIPNLKATHHIPTDLVNFHDMLQYRDYSAGIHFYLDDYKIEKFWRQPYKYIEIIARFDCALSPDCSLYMDMPMAMKIWNVYRSRLLGQMMQDAGIIVIPTLQWAEESTFDFCFDGVEPGGVYSVSTMGIKESKTARQIWKAGMDEAIRRLKPEHIVNYGGDIGYEYPCGVTFIENHTLEKLRGGGGGKSNGKQGCEKWNCSIRAL